MKTEHILAVPTDVYKNTHEGFGFEQATLNASDIVIRQREGLETDPTHRQLISYTVVRCGGRVLTYARTTRAGEARLHGQVSIGFGGHVDLDDVVAINSVIDLNATLDNASRRELNEELTLGLLTGRTCMSGHIVSNANDTDRVHVGLVGVVESLEPHATSREDQIEIIGWLTREELQEQFGDRLESWSAGLVENGQVFLG